MSHPNATIRNVRQPVSPDPLETPPHERSRLESFRNNEPVWGHDIVFGRVPEPAVVYSLANTKGCTWAAASYASQTAARLQLESGRPVMPLGGFAGGDPSPTLKEFEEKVASGEICYFVQQEAFVQVQDPNSSSMAISSWIQNNFQSETMGDTTVYRLTKQ